FPSDTYAVSRWGGRRSEGQLRLDIHRYDSRTMSPSVISVMRRSKATALPLLAAVAALTLTGYAEATYSVIHTHMWQQGNPAAGLVADGAGNVYGTTSKGGSSNAGLVFTMKVDGTAFKVLHTFAGGASDGANPQAALTLDGSGNLYGTTAEGGASNLGVA